MLSACAIGAEVKPAEVTPETSNPTQKANPPKPFLGVRFDESAVSLDQEPGMPISEVVSGSTAQALGIEADDRLLTLNGKATERTDDLSVILAGAKVGDPVSIEYLRAGSKTLVQGSLSERPKPANIAKDFDRLAGKLDAVRELAESQKREPTLAEILQQLKDIEAGLPRAVAAFKKQFPNGEFDIRLQVVITSDKNAKNPVEFSNQSKADEKKPADEKAPATTAEPKAEAKTEAKAEAKTEAKTEAKAEAKAAPAKPATK
jgi:hypothetical protein